jgi:hypothetical protein
MSKKTAEITVESVIKVVNEGRLTSLTQVSKALGLGTGSVSGSVSKRLRQLVPTIDAMLAQYKGVKGEKPEGKPTEATPQDDGETLCPFRGSSKYAAIWMALYRHRKTGVTRKALVEEITASDKRFADPKTADYAVTVVASPTRDGGAHRSADRAGDVYWVEKSDGGHLQLHLRVGRR